MHEADRAGAPVLSRRGLLTLAVGAFVVGTVPLAARGGRRALVRRTVPVMGTVAELAVAHGDPAAAHRALDLAVEELSRVERLLTRFSAASDVGRANGEAATRPVAVSGETAAVIEEALGWAEASDGAFDPALGRAVALWDVTARRTPPPEAAVRRLAGRGLHRAVAVDAWRGSPVVRFADPDVALDLGGIGKGHGVDRAVQALRQAGVTRAIVNVGGDLYALGRGPDGAPWRVGIRSPWDPEGLAGEVEVEDAAVATSGDYLQYFVHAGRRYHHLLDPGTGAPRRTTARSVTVLAGTCQSADAGATAVFGMAPERARRLLQARVRGARLVMAIAEAAAEA